MKYTFCEKLMWFALAGPSFKYLEQQGVSLSKKETKETYYKMVARTPDIGSLKENPLRICLSGGMVWLSIFKGAKGMLTKEVFGDMVTASMDSPLIRASFKIKSKVAFKLETQKAQVEKNQEVAKVAKSNPFCWDMQVILGRDANEYTKIYRQCGLCALGRQEGLAHLVPYMCVLDIMSIDWMGGVLYRTKTLATGGDCCDFYICKKGSKWHEERQQADNKI